MQLCLVNNAVKWRATTRLDDSEDDGGHVKQEERHFAPEDVPEAMDRGAVVSGDARQEHLASDVATQRLRLRVAVDTVTCHVDRPVTATQLRLSVSVSTASLYSRVMES